MGPVHKKQHRAREDEELSGGEAERREAGAAPDVPGKGPPAAGACPAPPDVPGHS